MYTHNTQQPTGMVCLFIVSSSRFFFSDFSKVTEIYLLSVVVFHRVCLRVNDNEAMAFFLLGASMSSSNLFPAVPTKTFDEFGTANLSVFLSQYLSLSCRLSVDRSIYHSVHPSVHPFLRLTFHISPTHQLVCLSVHPPIHPMQTAKVIKP